jgi:hypothetical protein
MTNRSLADVLAVVHGSRHRFSTLQAVLTRVVDHPLQERAEVRAAGEHLRQLGEDAAPASQQEDARRRAALAARLTAAEEVGSVTTRLRLSVEIPDRLRLEEPIAYDGRPELRVHVLDGHVWQGYDPERGARFQHGGYEALHAFREVAPLLDPFALLGGQDLEVVEEAEWADRAALRVRARPRAPLFRQLEFTNLLLFGGTEHELLVDAERGVLLRLESRLDGTAFRVFELGEVTFDAEIPASTWVIEAPDGQPLRPLEPSHNHPISLGEAIAKAPCRLFLPDRAPAGSELSIMVVPDRSDPAKAGGIGFAYSWTGGTHRVQLLEAAHRSPSLDELGEWQEITRAGQQMMTLDGPADPSGAHLQRFVTLERDGTHIVISGNLSLDTLIEIAATLRPVSETPPDV